MKRTIQTLAFFSEAGSGANVAGDGAKVGLPDGNAGKQPETVKTDGAKQLPKKAESDGAKRQPEARDADGKSGPAGTDDAEQAKNGPAEAGGAERAESASAEAPDADGEKKEAASVIDAGGLLRKAALAARMKAAETTARRWEREAEALKEIYPDFSLEQALRGDEGFAALLKAGAPVRLAYEAAHLETILGTAMRYAAREAGRRMARSMAADANRIREMPVLDRAASMTKKDVASLTEKEIMKILRQVSDGKKVVF